MKAFIKRVWVETNKKQKVLMLAFLPVILVGMFLGFFTPVMEASIEMGSDLFESLVEWADT